MKLDGWVRIDTFGNSADIYAKDNRRVLVDRNSKRVICRYMFRDGSGDELRNVKERGKQVEA